MPSGSLYATWADVSEYLDNVPSSASAVIESIARKVSRAIDLTVGYPLYDLGSGSRYFDGAGGPILTFDMPLRSLSSMTVSSASVTRGVDFYLYPANGSPFWYAVRAGAGAGEYGLLGALPGETNPWWLNPRDSTMTWGTSPLGVVVTGCWGYSVVPEPIVEVAIEMTIRLWKARDQGFADVVGVGGYTVQGLTKSWTDFSREILEGYRVQVVTFA